MFNRVTTPYVFTLTVQRPMDGLVTVGLTSAKSDAALDQPIISIADAWTDVLEIGVQQAFKGRDVTFLLSASPLQWSDVEPNKLAPRFVPSAIADPDFHIGYAPQVSEAALRHAAQSEDFLHAALLIAALPSANDASFVAALQYATAHYPDQRTYERLSPDDLQVLFAREMERKAAAGVEFMECDYDGDNLYWYQPSADALAACLTTWQQFATARQWQFQAF